jgi:hypothetical protein
MAVHNNREAFIPYSRQEIINLCLADGKIPPEQEESFHEFCQILAAYSHFKFHRILEDLKANFVPFNPDLDRPYLEQQPKRLSDMEQMEEDLIESFTRILTYANYYPIPQKTLEKALTESSLFDLKTEVDFNDFERMVCYYRGDISQSMSIKKWWFKKSNKEIEIFERVVLLIKFKEEQHFQEKLDTQTELSFKPGKIYCYLYKNLSKLDIEFIFPNVKMSMTWKDKLLFGVPAIGAAIPLVLKTLPQLILIAGVILYLTLGHQPIEKLEVKEEEVRNITTLLITLLSLVITLGGFAFKQYLNYKNKQMRFQKSVTETLFYRNIASSQGVFQYLIDAAEEEECKEIILVYYHLLTSNIPLTAEELDDRIEDWLETKFGTTIDFNIQHTLQNLATIQGEIKQQQSHIYSMKKISLLKRDRNNFYSVISLDEAKQVIDYVWDNAFHYA